MKINTTWTFGNFNITASCNIEVAEPVNATTAAMLRKGFLQLLQRSPASAAEKALAGYEKRPAGFKRDSIAYSEEAAAELVTAFGTEVEVEDGVKLPFAITKVEEHVGGETEVSRKTATTLHEQWLALDDESPMKAATPLAFGFDPNADAAEQIEAIHAKLAGARKPKGK